MDGVLVLEFDNPQKLLDLFAIEVPDPDHAVRCAWFAGSLFDDLDDRLELASSDRKIAVVAALFHDSGYLRGARDHHRRSFDVLTTGVLQGFDRREQVITACAARYHGRTLPSIEHAGFGEMETEDQRRTRRLSAIVRLAVACDFSHLGVIRRVSARSSDDGVILSVTATEEPSVDRDRLREAAGGFTALTYVPLRVEISIERSETSIKKG